VCLCNGPCSPLVCFLQLLAESDDGVTQLAHRYKSLHSRFKAPYGYLALNAYRSVFVTDRMENPERPGPSNEGASIIMGNSVRQWHASYWPTKRQTQVGEATGAMQVYREALLSEARVT
jgi:hypothetical protein